MPTPTQEYSITYGGLEFGGATAYTVDAGPTLSQKPGANGTHDTASVSWRVFFQSSTKAGLDALDTPIKDKFSDRFLDLLVKIDGQEFINWSHSGNTGFNGVGSWSEITDGANTGFSKAYELTVVVVLPASDNGGLRFASTSLGVNASNLERVTFSGQYTALPGISARAQYNASSPGYCATILASLGGGPYELVNENPVTDDKNKLCDWTRVYEEIIFSQKPGSVDDSAIVNHTVTFSIVRTAPGDTPGGPFTVGRLAEGVASYECNVDHTNTKKLEDLWRKTLRQYVYDEIKRRSGGSIVAMTVDDLEVDATANTINCKINVVLSIGSATAYSYSVIQEYIEDKGAVIRRVHAGNRHAKYVYIGPSDTTRVTTITAQLNSLEAVGKVLGKRLASPEKDIPGNLGKAPRTTVWVETARRRSVAPSSMGLSDGTTLPTTQVVEIITELWVEAPPVIEGGSSRRGDLAELNRRARSSEAALGGGTGAR